MMIKHKSTIFRFLVVIQLYVPVFIYMRQCYLCVFKEIVIGLLNCQSQQKSRVIFFSMNMDRAQLVKCFLKHLDFT